MSELKRTPFFDVHVRAGARLVPFAGWEMPVQYAGVIPEVKAVREACGVFDVSHMAQLYVEGSDAGTLLNKVVSADWSTVEPGRATYGLLVTEAGGVLDDVMGYRLSADRWLVVANASRFEVDYPHLKAHLGDALTGDGYGKAAMLAIQGAASTAVLAKLTPVGPTSWNWRDVRETEVAGVTGVLSRTGYTGSDGFEFMFPAEAAETVWNALMEAGAVPAGLGARDVLRLEAGLPLYGHELRDEWTPAESGVGFAFKPAKGEFTGREAAQRAPQRKIIALQSEGRGIPREGYEVARNGAVIGEITSGTMSPTVGAGIALASVRLDAAPELEETVDILIRGTAHPARVVKRPFVPHYRP